MSEENLPVKTNIDIDDIKSTIKGVLGMDEFPDDKNFEISVELMVVPKNIRIVVSKKK